MSRCIPIALVGLALAQPLQAHQLDEYLQATRLDFSTGQIVVELGLTPGVSIAPQVLAMIDRDGDHRATPDEIASYARQVLRDLSLSIDDRLCALTLTSAESPPWDDMREGTGTIRLKAVAAVSLARGRHHVFYENRHVPASSVYLVNALRPSTRGLAIGAPRRDVLQHHIDFEVEVAAGRERAMWIGVAGLTLALLGLARRPRGASHHSPVAAARPSAG